MASSGMPRTGTAIMVSGGSTSAAHSGSPIPTMARQADVVSGAIAAADMSAAAVLRSRILFVNRFSCTSECTLDFQEPGT